MERFIGLDAHLSSCTFGVVGPSGKRLRTDVVDTTEGALVNYVRGVRGTRHLCLEEGTMSEWLYEVLAPHVQDIVVMIPPPSKGPKSDALDAIGLANKLRLNDIETAVFKGYGQFKRLREVSRIYTMVTTDVVRVQNRIKSLYRSRGVATPSQQAYSQAGRKQWLERLPLATRLAINHLYAEYDALVPIKTEAQKAMIEESHRHPQARKQETTPGFGPVRVAQAMAVVVTPYRFRTKRQFWSYCGLGIVMRSSSDYQKQDGHWVRAQVQTTRGLNPRFNRQLKTVFKGAATTVITNMPRSPLGEHYARQIAGETKPNLAKLTLARKIAAIFLAMWKKEEEYDPKQYR